MKIDYICSDCARKNGATGIIGNYTSWHVGKCDVCKQETHVCKARAWKHLREVDLGGRD